MQRRRTVPLTFEEKIEAEKAKFEAQAVKLKPGPQQEALLGKIKELDTATPLAFVAATTTAETGLELPRLPLPPKVAHGNRPKTGFQH